VLPEYPQHHRKLAFRELAGEVIVIDLEKSLFYSLNPVGSMIWQCCDGQTAVVQIVDRIVAEFEVDPATAEADCRAWLADLTQRGIISWRGTSDGRNL
jgi:hypothetical protein